jgi:hypothetical protein
MSDEQVAKEIENDYRSIVDWAGDEWSDMHEIELKRLISVNTDRYREHLKEHGEISDFQYI